MKDHTSRVWLILAVTGLGLYFMLPPKERLKLGIDLSGGTILVYEVDKANRPSSFQMDQMTAALSKRINPAGTLDVTIRPLVGADRVEIILPAADPQEVEAVKDRITQMGKLEFRILANEKHDRSAIRQAVEKLRKKEAETAPAGFQWVRLDDPAGFNAHGSSPEESNAVEDDFVLTKLPKDSERVTGDDLTRAEPTQDDRLQLAVGFHFNSIGTRKFAQLTRRHQPEPDGFHFRLAIVLDDRVMSAPVLKTAIEGGNGIIEGGRDGFKAQEVDNLVAVLNAGKLPAMLIKTPISVDKVTATLGEDTIRKGTLAILVSMIAVPIFMILYYRFSGLVATVALVINLILILGFMGLTQSTFTLPGLAGLALTVGMAVDANVLIAERMREEQERGSSLAQTVRNGFGRAWFAVIDSNLTTAITGIILWFLGSDQVKGFALTLVFGLLANLFTAVFVCRVIFEVWTKRGWLTRLRMLHLIKPPSIDWVSPRVYFIAASVVVNVIALCVTFARGTDVLDIDFTGGTAMSVRLTDPALGVDFVRAKSEEVLPNVKVERLISEGESGGEGLFLVRTTNANQTEVKRAIIQQFHGVLATVKIDKWVLEPVASAESAKTESDSKEVQDAKPKDESGSKPPSDGHRVRLTLNRPVSQDAIDGKFKQVLAARGLENPQLHYSLRPAESESTSLSKTFILETKEDVKSLIPEVGRLVEEDPIFERENNFGAQVAGETQRNAIVATVLSWGAMILYLWFRFKKASFGLAAVVSLIHDVLVALGFITVGGWIAQQAPGLAHLLLIDDFKIDLSVVAAFLTIIGYSVNDTIVVFDRLREIRGKSPVVTADVINQSVNQCMSRTILTSFTVMLVCVVMYVWGGPGIHAFSFAMLIGAFSGCYSTVFIAAPTLYLFEGPKSPEQKAESVKYQRATARAS
ncbi:MAG: protein translocase subunit SecD [Planctomycetes bacterium]|nr:protein translocase subunit SecD [Planctomycetota bacterium]